MRFIIASDIHGSLSAAQALLRAASEDAHARILLLGDLLYHGPRNDLPADYEPKAVIPLLNDLAARTLCVRGNCDSEVDQMVLSFPIQAPCAWIAAGDVAIFATHGHLYDPETHPLPAGDIFISGHTHVSGHWQRAKRLCLNPGSMGLPKGDTPAGYMTFDGKAFAWHLLNGQEYDKLEL